VSIFEFSHFFAILYSDFVTFLQKRKNWKTNLFKNFVITPKVFKIKVHKMPHFKALDE